MAGGLDRYKPLRPGIRAVLKSGGVVNAVEARVDRIATAVRSDLAGTDIDDDWNVVANVRLGQVRAVGLVSGVPLSIELEHRIMARAVSA